VTDAPEEEKPTEAGPPARPPALVLAISLAVVFGVLAAVFGVLAVRGDDGEGEGTTSLRRAAGEMAEAFFTWDHRDLDAHRDRVLALATGSFRSEYEDQFDASIRDVITTAESTSQAFVKDVYVSEIDEERAEAVVVVDLEQDGVAGPRTQTDIYVVITFVEVDGQWKVDDVTDPFPVGGLPGGATTSSVPVP
jgi:Mce-associated membrane protein